VRGAVLAWILLGALGVTSDRIFPRPTSRGVALFAEGGTAEVVSLRAWPLAPPIRR
jgi:sucrose-6-phosphate hydrolase SacC (GH32 family)